MADAASLTLREKILLAADSLGEGEFRAQQLVVRAWEMFPESFALRDVAPSLPCSNTVYAKLAGQSRESVVGRAWLSCVGERRYVVTPAGRRMAAALRGETPKRGRRPQPASPVEAAPVEVPARAVVARVVEAPVWVEALSEVERAEVERLHRSGVHQRALRGLRLQLGDAFAFWALHPHAGPDGHAARIERVELVLRKAMGPARAPATRLRVEAAALLNTHAVLRGRFAGALGIAQGYGAPTVVVDAEGAAA